MERFTQRQLLESFSDIVRGAIRVSGVAAKKAAQTILPKTTAAVGSAVKTVQDLATAFGDAIPSKALQKFVSGDAGKRYFKTVSNMGNERELNNRDREISFKTDYVNQSTQKVLPIQATATLRHQNGKWVVVNIKDSSTQLPLVGDLAKNTRMAGNFQQKAQNNKKVVKR